MPDRPDAWLLTAARRRLIDQDRRRRTFDDGAATLALAAEEAEEAMNAGANAGRSPFPDDRLKLLFICAHPAIDPAVRTPLMLQTVLGLEASRIAPAFLVTPAAMAQRLVRAKTKIRDAGVPFAEPEPAELGPRVAAVLEAIYAAYGTGWDEIDGRDDLAAEAIDLARLAAGLMPGEPEARGLLALVLFCEARRPARRDAAGAFVPLSEQDVRLWSKPMLAEAERTLLAASEAGRAGPFQIEAAIQAAHAERARGRPVPWRAIAGLYGALVAAGGGLGAAIGQAAAVAKVDGPEAALALLDRLDPRATATHQPYWACRAHLLAARGDPAAAKTYGRAVALTGDAAVRAFLESRQRDC